VQGRRGKSSIQTVYSKSTSHWVQTGRITHNKHNHVTSQNQWHYNDQQGQTELNELNTDTDELGDTEEGDRRWTDEGRRVAGKQNRTKPKYSNRGKQRVKP